MEVRVAKLTGPRALVWERETTGLSSSEPQSILCRTRFSAISPGTEVAAYLGAEPLRPGKIYPRVVGYCNVAEVLEVGAGVTACRPGDLVVTHQSHREAFVCHQRAVLAILEPVFDPALASVSYLFHLGYAALLKAQFRPGNSVGVIGLGPIGLATLGLASSGGGTAYGFSNQKDIADTARQAGAIEVRSKDISAGAELDIVVTTSNTWPDWHLALNAARPGGTIAVLGFPGRGQPAPDFNPLASQFLYDKQLTVMACGMLPNIDVSPADVRFTVKRNMQWLVNQVGLARLPAQHLVSEIAVADKLGDLYERLANREAGLVTAVLKW